jgi:type IV fimbrial biogenesis protein FimT
MRSRKHNWSLNSGFSLIELIVTVAVLGIVVSIGLPSLRDFLVSNRLSANINSFIGLVNYARSEAITRNQNVVICPKTAGANTCSSSVAWNTLEIQAFVDVDSNADFSNGDVLLKTLPAFDTSSSETVFQRPTGTANPGGTANITFSAVGFSRIRHNLEIYAVKSGDAAYQAKYGRWLCVSQPGRVTVVGYVSSFTTTTCLT